eukprot:NODE_72_length_23514_cov_0.560624.p6 type:complete len:312 gc:universal NODE_72_length_23514_cov_0.560624:21399-22334(+)
MFFCHECLNLSEVYPCSNCQSEFLEESATVNPLEELGHAFVREISRATRRQNQDTQPDETARTNSEFNYNLPRHRQNNTETNRSQEPLGSQDMLFNIFDLINSVGDGVQFQMGSEGGLNDLLNQLFQQHETQENPVPKNVLNSFKRKEFLTPKDCAICQDILEYGLELKCKHVFHEDCIKEWFKSHNTCPICRAEVCPAEECEPIERPTSVPPPRRAQNQQHNRSRSVPRNPDPISVFVNSDSNERGPISPPFRRRYIQPGDLGFVMMESEPLPEVNTNEATPANSSEQINTGSEHPPRRRSFFSRLFGSN